MSGMEKVGLFMMLVSIFAVQIMVLATVTR